jgi:hypothetical protein
MTLLLSGNHVAGDPGHINDHDILAQINNYGVMVIHSSVFTTWPPRTSLLASTVFYFDDAVVSLGPPGDMIVGIDRYSI